MKMENRRAVSFEPDKVYTFHIFQVRNPRDCAAEKGISLMPVITSLHTTNGIAHCLACEAVLS